jgi:hypothetical protein
MSEVREIFYFGNRIITDVERGKLCLTNRSDISLLCRAKSTEITNAMLKILQPLNTIVTEIQFLQILQCFQIFDFSDAVRLQRKDFEASQTVEILTVIASINVTAISETHTSSFVILFLPSQSSSRLARASRFSICCVWHVSENAN